ncbi:trace amine-associated receptor 1-like [Erpetoichthys calabaricus]|uniref:trace amine-associated receptor 1-like n=1 Tax=Erpetoichthys calabaricus TaxID=27687 RepID=UPI002234C015|nr:trace amine-associated receptor 1-like [Erpetoichthys calabaricus]
MYSLTIHIIIYVILCTIITFTISGNLLVIIIISHFRQLHTPTNFLTLSLAVADFLLGGIVMPPSMIRSVEACWYFGDFFCKFHTSTDIMLSATSIIHLFFISVDRYYAVCHPFKYRTKINLIQIGKIVLISWSLPVIQHSEYYYFETLYCVGSCIPVQSVESVLLLALLTFYIPGCIMIGIYLKIFIVAKKQARAIRETMESKYSSTRKREAKAAKTLAIVIVVFLVCWCPFILCNSILNYETPARVVEALIWISYLNSAFNPFIYAFFYTWFRKALRIIVMGNIFRNNSSLTKLYME